MDDLFDLPCRNKIFSKTEVIDYCFGILPFVEKKLEKKICIS